MLKKATSDTQWLTAKPEELETVMANAAKAREPSLARTTGEVGLAFQTYSLRNVLRTGMAAIGAEKAGMGEVATAAISHAVNTAVSAPVYFAWTSAAVLTGPATDKAAGALQGARPRCSTAPPTISMGDPPATSRFLPRRETTLPWE